jgi:Zn-dependent protease
MNITSIILAIVISAPALLVAITFHEVAHGLAASAMGDKTAKMLGRLSLNPIKHIDLAGTIIIPILLLVVTRGQFSFGYAKPVPINPRNFKNPRRGMALSAAAGPAMNFALTVACVIIIRFIIYPLNNIVSPHVSEALLQPLFLIIKNGIVFNIILGIFNLIPIPPLDGGRIAVGFLPPDLARPLSRLEPYGIFIVLFLIYFVDLGFIFEPVLNFFLRLIQ